MSPSIQRPTIKLRINVYILYMFCHLSPWSSVIRVQRLPVNYKHNFWEIKMGSRLDHLPSLAGGDYLIFLYLRLAFLLAKFQGISREVMEFNFIDVRVMQQLVKWITYCSLQSGEIVFLNRNKTNLDLGNYFAIVRQSR